MKLLFLLLPFLAFSQFQPETFLFTSIELDIRNALVGSDVNPAAIDGVFNLGFRDQNFQIQASYENFRAIDFYSFGFKGGYVFNYGGNFNYLLLGGISLIQRNVEWTKRLSASVSLNGQAEYHLNPVFLLTRIEGRYRGDIKEIIPSVYAGIGIKF